MQNGKLINDSVLAILYYNLLEANKYDLSVYEDRKRANNNFKNSKKFDIPKLKEAFKLYKEMQKEEFESLLVEKSKTAKEKEIENKL